MSTEEYPKLGGYVTESKDMVGMVSAKRENPFGLFSQQIFGPVKEYECMCKKLIGNGNSGNVCPDCGVICGSDDYRYTQFGKIETVFPFIKPSKKSQVKKYLGPLSNILMNPDRCEVNLDSKKYLAVKYDRSKMKIVETLDNIQDYLVIPFRVTGIYSLYLVVKFAGEYLGVQKAKELLDKKCITNELKVLPPNLRAYSFDSDKNTTRTPIVNKLYVAVLNLNKNNIKMIDHIKQDEEDFLEKIKIHLKDKILDQDIVESTIFHYDTVSSGYQRNINSIYNYVYSLISGKTGLIRSLILGRIIEFSGRTVITVDPSLPPYQMKVSKDVLKTLWMPYFLHYLTHYKNLDYTECFQKYMIEDKKYDEDYNQLFEEFLDWFYDYGDDNGENLGS